MNSLKQFQSKRNHSIYFFLLILFTGVSVTGCADSKSVRFKINSVPKGAHVLYQVKGDSFPCQEKWIYLGNTPLMGVQNFNERQLEDASKITLRVMHNGYHPQSIEWDGERFWQEVEEKDVIFWTPELSPNVK